MPELPEVETVVQGLRAAGLQGARSHTIRILRPSVVQGDTPEDFVRNVRGRAWSSIDRRGKYICVTLDDASTLLIHLRMTGRPRVDPQADNPNEDRAHDRIVFAFDPTITLRLHDSRAFARVRWLAAGAESPLSRLGPEPLSPVFTAAWLRQALTRHTRALKPLLLDQQFIAGLGNIYVDESLWEAQLHPATPAHHVDAAAATRLHRAIRRVLHRALAAGGTTLGTGITNFYSVAGHRGDNDANLRVFRRHGAPCPRCGADLARIRLFQRGTHFCPQCQPTGERQ